MLRDDGEVVFYYDPGSNGSPPRIEQDGEGGVRISVSDVAEVFVQKDRRRGLSIQYSIGRILCR